MPYYPPATGTVTKESIGLGNVDNTADASKPVSSAQQTAIDGKVTAVTAGLGLWKGTQAEYDALGSKSNSVIYAITG